MSRVGHLSTLLLLFLLAALLPSSTSASDFDIIFVIDQSGSMQRLHGPDEQWPPTDPYDNRLEAVFLTVENLQAALNRNKDTQLRYRLYIVEFGDSVKTHPPYVLSYDPASPVSAPDAKARVRGNLIRRDLGFTNTKRAFEEVAARLDAVPSASRDNTWVILVTDGKPYVQAFDKAPSYENQYKNELSTLIRGRITSRATLDVIGLLRSDNPDEYWPTWGPFWDALATGTAIPVMAGPEISRAVDDLARERMGLSPAIETSNPYFCPPYLKAVTFTVFKKRRGAGVTIKDPDQIPIDPTYPGATIESEATYKRMTIEDPKPGYWELERNAVDITVELMFRDLMRIRPKRSANIGIPERFQYKVLSESGRPFAELPNFPVDARLRVTSPTGQETSIDMSIQTDNSFLAQQELAFRSPGDATLVMVGTTSLPTGEDVEIFNTKDFLPVTDKIVLNLDAGTSLPAYLTGFPVGKKTLSLNVGIEASSGAGQAPSLDTLSRNPSNLVFVRVRGADGIVMSERIPMEPQSDGTLTAAVPVEWRGGLFSRMFGPQQEMFVRADINDNELNSDYLIVGLEREAADPDYDEAAAIPELRNDPNAAPMVLRVNQALTILIALPLLVLCGWVLYRYGRKIGYIAWDYVIARKRVFVAVGPPMAHSTELVKKILTGDYRQNFKGPKVLINIGESEGARWQPDYLKIRRLFRPWAGCMVVRLTYPVGDGKKALKKSTVVLEGKQRTRLEVPVQAEAYLEITKLRKEVEKAGWQ